MLSIHALTNIAILAPLTGALIAGIGGKFIGRTASHRITISLVGVALVAACMIAKAVFVDGQTSNTVAYTWAVSGDFKFVVGYMIDQLSAMMLIVVTFISLLVHIYSIGYMDDDPGYARFFSYMSLFTFAMLMLVTANNFMQIFFGWEGVGVVSYLLIGFWFNKDSANAGSMKAFLVNRVGDFGFLLGIALVLNYFGTLDYVSVFAKAPSLVGETIALFPGHSWSLMSVICILLFVGAMGKSAQMPLHVWLPESMEGPTPISALIHAATMVTAGIFMVSRMSPLFELSDTALSVVLIIGATGALFTGLIAVVQTDIKKVVAYSTLSQLGYMIAALGASAFTAGMFHLVTHAFFKALLFLGAGSVIIAMHHEQDMSKMGNLKKYMPITYATFFIGSLSLAAVPPFSGFYSKEAIIEVIHLANIPGATYAYWCVTLGAFFTALYSFRALFYTFHTQERMDKHTQEGLKESPWVVWLPLVILAVPSAILGFMMVGPMLFDGAGLLGNSVYVAPAHQAMSELAAEYKGPWHAVMHSFMTLPFWLSVAGIFVAWLSYIALPSLPGRAKSLFGAVHQLLIKKYGFDDFNQLVLVRGTTRLADWIYRVSDMRLIDGLLVNGAGRLVSRVSAVARKSQTGYLYHYAVVMVLGLLICLVWLMVR